VRGINETVELLALTRQVHHEPCAQGLRYPVGGREDHAIARSLLQAADRLA
jgi:hypothetical protein